MYRCNSQNCPPSEKLPGDEIGRL